jgi:uncharacterized protein
MGTVAAGGGIGAVVLAVAVYLLSGGEVVLDPSAIAPAGRTVQSGPISPEEQELGEFVSVILADTEDTWRELFPREFGAPYQEPRLVLFSGATESACGVGQAAMGPFYCPLDQSVFIDLSFYRELRERFGAPGEFAQAYVIAHEVGHHVQNLLGISEKVLSSRQRMSRTAGNELSVRQELQADCLSGVWAHHAHRARNILEQGDVEDGLRAASAIGDDRMQRETRGRISPETFTHGTSEQRVRWFRRGIDSGEVAACDTFAAAEL